MLWVFVTAIAVIVSVAIVVYAFAGDFISELPISPAEPVDINWLAFFRAVGYVILSVLSGIVTLIFILVLSNTGRMKKHKFLKAILIYIGLMIIMSEIGNLISNAIGYLAFSIVWIAVLYIISRYLIIHKLELE
jgi:hypothetical protein